MQSDERLAELASAGHESAFDAIVDRYRTPLTRYCAGIVGPSRAEDAVQQALINAHDALQRTDEVRNLRSWLYRIAHNAALNVLRAVRDDVPLDEATLHGPRGGASSRVAAAASPAESFERSEEFRSTLAALQALPDRQRAALVLRELEGRSHEEIAAALGVTKGSARQHLMRARVAVRSAVTALTPYPLIARLAEWTSAGAGAAGTSGWVEGAATAGAGASLAKLTAGLAATGALVGGAVGTEHVIRGGADAGTATPAAAERSAEPAVKRANAATVVVPAAAVTPAAASGTSRRASATRPASSKAPSSPRRRARGSAPRDVAAAVPSLRETSTSLADDHGGSGSPAGGDAHRSEQARQKSSHGKETSSSHRSENAAGGKDKASKDEKHAAKKEGKGDPPGQAKKTAPSSSTPASSNGKGPKGDSNASGSDGSSKSSGSEDGADGSATAGTLTAETPTPATSSSPATGDDED